MVVPIQLGNKCFWYNNLSLYTGCLLIKWPVFAAWTTIAQEYKATLTDPLKKPTQFCKKWNNTKNIRGLLTWPDQYDRNLLTWPKTDNDEHSLDELDQNLKFKLTQEQTCPVEYDRKLKIQ